VRLSSLNSWEVQPTEGKIRLHRNSKSFCGVSLRSSVLCDELQKLEGWQWWEPPEFNPPGNQLIVTVKAGDLPRAPVVVLRNGFSSV
jgi:hypothetical protein